MKRVDEAHPVRREAEGRLVAAGTIDGFFPLFLFEKQGTLQQALHLMKYSGMHSVASRLGEELGKEIVRMPGFAAADWLVPVPLHSARLRERGYNQSGKICEGMGRSTGIRVLERALIRGRNTPSQTKLAFHEREENVRGAFSIVKGRAGLLRGTTVTLVDDVLTTGSTVLASAAALRGAGVSSILVSTVAVAERTV
jgi:ComF family protein